MSRARVMFMVQLMLFFAAGLLWAADNSDAPKKVAVFPFSMHTPGELNYLQDGIRDMYSSRLEWQGKVQVIDRTVIDQALHGKKGDVSIAEAIQIAAGLKADYVLFGSVTALGKAISIDGKMALVSGNKEPLPVYVQANTLDEVIPKINQSAQQINQKVFARSTDQTQASSADSDSGALRNPEQLAPGSVRDSSDRLSYINPNFIEITPESTLRKAGIWKSQRLSEGIVGVDVGDIDGDNRPELVTVSESKVTVFRREANGLKPIATFKGSNMERFVWVCLADVDHDGKPEIHVSNLQLRNDVKGNTSEKIGYGQDTFFEVRSFGLRFVGGKLEVIYKDAPYFLNAMYAPPRGKLLLGQEKGDSGSSTFKGDIYEMSLKEQSLVGLMPFPISSRCNVFNFARADLNKDGSEETLVIDPSNHLIVLSSSGEEVWKSSQRFAATSNGFTGKVTDLRYNQVDYYYIPSNILLTDINKDKFPEINITRSPDYDRFMPQGLKYFNQGEVVSFSYDQLGLVENWKTRDLNGMVTAIRISDLNNDGKPELIASVVHAKDLLKFWDSQSTIVTFDLNLDDPKNEKVKPQ
ncbi:MAG: FG-GAP-like repeat-containing protein [Syntrophobacteraceae bacterium]